MSERRTEVTPELESFLAPFWADVPPIVSRIQEEIHQRGSYPMQVSFEQVALHAWLARLVGARRVLEIGTYFGLSACGFAAALPPDGHVDTVEIDPAQADIAEGLIREGGLGDRVTVHRGAALTVVPKLAGPYDLVFIDGDKQDNPALLDLCASRTRVGGLVMVDNAFRDGSVATEEADGTRRALEMARDDPRLDPVVLPVADGLLVCRRVRQPPRATPTRSPGYEP